MLWYNNKKHILRIMLGLFLAFIVNRYYSFSHEWWLPLATFMVMLTDTGSAIYQGVIRYIVLLLVMGMLSWIFKSDEWVHVRAYDITLGALIGIVVNSAIFPDRVDVLFRQAVEPILKCYIAYLQSIIHLLLTQEKLPADKQKIRLEKALQKLPTWVYETGFDLALQKGHRYFVMKVNEVSEILFSMHHLARYPFSHELLEVITTPLSESGKKGEQFFHALNNALNLQFVSTEFIDFYQEIENMENNFRKKVPLSVDVLDISKEYVYLIEFIYHFRELHDILIKMAEALNNEDLKNAL